ncbi:L,D-transpeptidase [Ligilactobacillus hayakitensis]|nr:L,D-transpeptidase [Ligilactobacillus hayakitensis]
MSTGLTYLADQKKTVFYAANGQMQYGIVKVNGTEMYFNKSTGAHERDKDPKVDWRGPSEDKPYPDVNKYPNMWVKVSTTANRVYLMNGNQVLYTMLASTGARGMETPKGTFYIQGERGNHFFNQYSREGANYWVSFKDHGVYLFHSVPVDVNGNYIVKEAEQLGKQSLSHGCIRLSVSDAKWFYQNIKYGTKVVIN